MAKKAAATATASESPIDSGVILQLDPATVLADDNTRFNLKESRILTLAESIVNQGGVIEPVEVEPLAEPQDGFKYRLTLGFYRHAAVKHLNTTQAAGLTLPAILHVNQSPMDRLKRQLAENIERESNSPMDEAVVIKRLFSSGVPRIEIRQMFSRPGGRKGSKVQPQSNSFINMRMSFLELPKSIQEKVHQGLIGVGAAYQLTKVDKDKQTAILQRAEEERQKELEREEKEEERFLTSEKKSQEKQTQVQATKALLEASEVASKESSELLEKQTALTAELFKVSKGKHSTPKDKKAAEAAFKDAEKQRESLEKKAEESQKEYEKAQVSYGKLTEAPKPKAEVAKPKKQTVGGADIKRAAESEATGAVALNANEMRKVIAGMTLPTGDPKDAKVIAIGQAIASCFAGVITDTQLYKEIRKIAG